MKVLDSICRNRLLLVPERVEWNDPTQSDRSKKTYATQRRSCFTELTPEELTEHTAIFGAFAIELSIENLRHLGAMPVIYVPDTECYQEPHDATGTSLLANIASVVAIVSAITETQHVTGPTVKLKLTMNDGERIEREFNEAETAAIREYLYLLEKCQGIPYVEIHNALCSMSSLFYPADNLRRSDILGYYRQREWRLFSGMHYKHKPSTDVATASQVQTLLDIDSTFFTKKLEFPDGAFTLAEKSHFLHIVFGKHFLEYANRIIVPPQCLGESAAILQRYGFTIQITDNP